MQSLKFLISACFFILLNVLNSCTNEGNTKVGKSGQYTPPTTREGVMQENLEMVRKSEDKLKANKSVVINDAVGLSMISVYANYIRNFPEDKKNCPDFLYKAAEISMNLKQGANAILYIDDLKNKYPDAKQVPYAEFMRGFVYQNILNDKDKAKATFSNFINKYPQNELVPSAKQILESIDMTEADFLKKIKGK